MKEKARNILCPMGTRNYAREERETNDYYATHPSMVKHLLRLEDFRDNILEPMCGEGHIAKTLVKKGFNVTAFDLIDRGYGKVQNFLTYKPEKHNFDIITNPPYKDVDLYVYKCMRIMNYKKEEKRGRVGRQKTALFLRLLFLEGRSRRAIFDQFPPVRIWVASSRARCAKNGEFEKYTTSAMAYAWFIWESGYKGDTILKWFN